jgi:hypothetical protein
LCGVTETGGVTAYVIALAQTDTLASMEWQ